MVCFNTAADGEQYRRLTALRFSQVEMRAQRQAWITHCYTQRSHWSFPRVHWSSCDLRDDIHGRYDISNELDGVCSEMESVATADMVESQNGITFVQVVSRGPCRVGP